MKDHITPETADGPVRMSKWAAAPDESEGDARIMMAARSLPSWAALLSTAFTVGSGICLLSLGVLAVFFQSLVAERSQTLMAVILVVLGTIPVLGALLFDFAHIRALAGYRSLRLAQARRASAGLAVLVALLLGILHPLLPLGILLAGLAGLAASYALSRRSTTEPLWDMTAVEATTLLAGRDALGLRLATTAPESHAIEAPLHRAITCMAVLVALASSSTLVGIGHLTTATLPGVVLVTLWASSALSAWLLSLGRPHALAGGLTAKVDHLPPDETSLAPGLHVGCLSVIQPGGRTLLSETNLEIEPGKIIGLIGPSGAGKSLLLRALAGPYDLAGLDVRGAVTANGRDLWQRNAESDVAPVVTVPSVPIMLPASGEDNLTCFHGRGASRQARYLLDRLIFSATEVDRICATGDATRLPTGQQKALSLARAFLLAPDLYLFDRPEDGLDDDVVRAFAARIQEEARLGRITVLITGNRALLDTCDTLVSMMDGRIVDFGDAGEIRSKSTAGWARLSGSRSLETEETLTLWIHGQFKRDGDEANRRDVTRVAVEMLAVSCETGSRLGNQRILFEFKNFKGHCILRLIDDDPAMSSGRIERARQELAASDGQKAMSPLANVLKHSEEFEATVEQDRRVLTARIASYDPRRTGPGGAPT